VEYSDIDVTPKRPVSIPPKKVHNIGVYYTTLGDKVICAKSFQFDSTRQGYI